MPAAKRKRRGRLTPVAVRRALYADRWLPRYYRAVKRELDAMVRQTARAALAGTAPEVAFQYRPQWAVDLAQVKKRWIYPIVRQGFDLAGLELGHQAGQFKSDDVLGKTKARPDPLDALGDSVIVGKPAKLKPSGDVVEAGDFLLEGNFEDIDEWIATTSAAEGRREVSTLRKIWGAAEASRDPETGAAWTPREIAKEISRKGLADSTHYANLLARTGTIWAMNEGAQQRYSAAGVTVMEWRVTVDDLSCFWCLEMDGRAVRTDDPFWKSGSEFGVKGDQGVVRTLRLKYEVQHPPLHPN